MVLRNSSVGFQKIKNVTGTNIDDVSELLLLELFRTGMNIQTKADDAYLNAVDIDWLKIEYQKN